MNVFLCIRPMVHQNIRIQATSHGGVPPMLLSTIELCVYETLFYLGGSIATMIATYVIDVFGVK